MRDRILTRVGLELAPRRHLQHVERPALKRARDAVADGVVGDPDPEFVDARRARTLGVQQREERTDVSDDRLPFHAREPFDSLGDADRHPLAADLEREQTVLVGGGSETWGRQDGYRSAVARHAGPQSRDHLIGQRVVDATPSSRAPPTPIQSRAQVRAAGSCRSQPSRHPHRAPAASCPARARDRRASPRVLLAEPSPGACGRGPVRARGAGTCR